MDRVISIRMPLSLVEELKHLAEKDHYLDTSDAIRSLLRREWLEQKSPHKSKILEMKKQLSKISDTEQIMAMKKTLKLLEELNELE